MSDRSGTVISPVQLLQKLPPFRWLWSRRLVATPVDPEFDRLSDSEVLDLVKDDMRSKLIGKMTPFGYPIPVYRITQNTVAKFSLDDPTASEPYMMAFVSSHTSIRVPWLRRCILDPKSGGLWIFMQYVDGDDLEDVWPSLSFWRKLYIVWTLRSYVRQLRRIKVDCPDRPGPIDGSPKPLPCRGRWFTEYGNGPFSTYADMSAWFQRALSWTIRLEHQMGRSHGTFDLPQFDDSRPLVVTHGDIALRNIRIAKNGTVWLLDWGLAGAYPVWFEFSAIMDETAGDSETAKQFAFFAPFIAGWYHKQAAFLKRIQLGISPQFKDGIDYDWDSVDPD